MLDISPYVPGKSDSGSTKRIIKLSSNETPLGTSDKVLNVLKNSTINPYRYPDGSANNLREALAKKHSLGKDRIICGNGSDEILSLLAHCFSGPGDEVIYSQHGFLVYPIAVKAAGANPVTAPEKNLRSDVESIIKLSTNNTKLCYIANPNNPTGTYLSIEELVALRRGLPEETILVIDSAYAEYVEKSDYSDGINLVNKYDNIVCTRTFSKIYGLAALRIGWMYASRDIVEYMNRIRLPFNTNSIAQTAAIEALKDNDFIKNAKKHNDIWKPWIEKKLQEIGLDTVDGVANFVLAKFNNELQANLCYQFLEKKGILVRSIKEYKLPEYLRITVGLEEENKIMCEEIKNFLNYYEK